MEQTHHRFGLQPHGVLPLFQPHFGLKIQPRADGPHPVVEQEPGAPHQGRGALVPCIDLHSRKLTWTPENGTRIPLFSSSCTSGFQGPCSFSRGYVDLMVAPLPGCGIVLQLRLATWITEKSRRENRATPRSESCWFCHTKRVDHPVGAQLKRIDLAFEASPTKEENG